MKSHNTDQSGIDTNYLSSPQRTHAIFTLFPRLATELRLQIWRLSFPPSRQISIWCSCQNSSSNEILSLFPSRFRNPVTSKVNYESRSETLRYYRRMFPNEAGDTSHRFYPFLFNPNIDTLFFQDLGSLAYGPLFMHLRGFIAADMEAVQNLKLVGNADIFSDAIVVESMVLRIGRYAAAVGPWEFFNGLRNFQLLQIPGEEHMQDRVLELLRRYFLERQIGVDVSVDVADVQEVVRFGVSRGINGFIARRLETVRDDQQQINSI